MLYQLLIDALNTLRFHYKHPAEYRYSPAAIIAVLILTGMVNAAGMAPVLGQSMGAISFSIVLTIFKWLILSYAMRSTLHYGGSPKLPIGGFILVSEALIIPSLTVFYFPAISTLAVFWQVWIFWAQAIGLMKMGNVSGFRVLTGYIIYILILMVVGTLLISLYGTLGWLDTQSIANHISDLMNAAATK